MRDEVAALKKWNATFSLRGSLRNLHRLATTLGTTAQCNEIQRKESSQTFAFTMFDDRQKLLVFQYIYYAVERVNNQMQ